MTKRRLAFLSFCLLLASCNPVRPAPTPTPAPIPPGLGIEEHALTKAPEAEYDRLYFAEGTQESILSRHADERSRGFSFEDRSCIVENHFAMCAALGTDRLAAWEDYAAFGSGHVVLTRNGKEIYRISIGDSSPISSLRGLWVYDDHWALETAYVTNRQKGNEISSEAVGRISIDGKQLNKQYGYQEAFGFQTIHGSPFFFFKRGGKIGVSFDGVEVPLGYSEVLHYGCCSAAMLNPQIAQNMVAFFALKGVVWYYVEIGVFTR